MIVVRAKDSHDLARNEMLASNLDTGRHSISIADMVHVPALLNASSESLNDQAVHEILSSR